MTIPEELALVKRAQGGDRDAMGLLWDAITPKLYGYLVNVLKDKEQADDALQNTWLNAMTALPRFEARNVRFSAWLFAIAKNVCRQQWRAAGRETNLETIKAAAEQKHEPDATLMIDMLLPKLSADDQEVLRLCYIADLNCKEIAAVLSISSLSARVRLHRARARARVLLEK